jgi:hypothetical protein
MDPTYLDKGVERSKYPANMTAVVLVTPAFAHLLEDTTFLKKCLDKIYADIDREGDMSERLHALAAVVDKLPTPRIFGSDFRNHIIRAKIARWNIPIGPQDNGLEGLAYMTMKSRPARLIPKTGSDDRGSINFVTNEERKTGDCTVEVPLAHTVFQTGQATTMFYSTWGKEKGTHGLRCLGRVSLIQAALPVRDYSLLWVKAKSGLIKKVVRRNSAEQHEALAIPLVPLTLPRTVQSGMGNIVSRVIGPEGTAVTASSELESAVPKYFESRGEAPHAMSVWALVIPARLVEEVKYRTRKQLSAAAAPTPEDWARVWAEDMYTDLVTFALSKGARLHRVLSGGGGWGKKAGLLSLDPSAYRELPHSPSSDDKQSEKAKEKEDPERASDADIDATVKEFVKSGEAIQFFASSPNLPKTEGQLELLKRAKADLGENAMPWTWQFGSIPSTMDETSKSWQFSGSNGANELLHFPYMFGALSEAGIVTKKDERKEGKWVKCAQKIDVPFARYSAIEVPAKQHYSVIEMPAKQRKYGQNVSSPRLYRLVPNAKRR